MNGKHWISILVLSLTTQFSIQLDEPGNQFKSQARSPPFIHQQPLPQPPLQPQSLFNSRKNNEKIIFGPRLNGNSSLTEMLNQLTKEMESFSKTDINDPQYANYRTATGIHSNYNGPKVARFLKQSNYGDYVPNYSHSSDCGSENSFCNGKDLTNVLTIISINKQDCVGPHSSKYVLQLLLERDVFCNRYSYIGCTGVNTLTAIASNDPGPGANGQQSLSAVQNGRQTSDVNRLIKYDGGSADFGEYKGVCLFGLIAEGKEQGNHFGVILNFDRKHLRAKCSGVLGSSYITAETSTLLINKLDPIQVSKCFADCSKCWDNVSQGSLTKCKGIAYIS